MAHRDTKKPKLYKPCSEDEFRELGAAIMRRSPEGKSERVFIRRWQAHFGVEPAVVADAWNRIKIPVSGEGTTDYAKPEHLLWGLLFLKMYVAEEGMAGMCGPEKAVDEQTFRKWSKLFIEKVEGLYDDVVSQNCV